MFFDGQFKMHLLTGSSSLYAAALFLTILHIALFDN